ncbi:MAG: GNAT family N-acetyltransferase [Coriobacteriia bacterium]
MDLAAREGWNPGLNDAACFHAADPGGFYLAEVDGQPVGCISAVSYGEQFGFIGLYIVAPEFRSQGVGMQLWRRAMERLDGHVVGLDGVYAHQKDYEVSDFVFAYRNIRFACSSSVFADQEGVDSHILSLSASDFVQVAELDRTCFPAARPAFLSVWIGAPDHTCLGYVDDGRLLGYGVIRPCRVGYKIGPLFAMNPDIADALLRTLARSVPGTAELYLDVPEAHAEALDLAKRYRMAEVFGTARMYLGGTPAVDLKRVFGVTTFELG